MIYARVSTRFGMLVFFKKLSLMEFQVRYLALFHLFSVIDGFGRFWIVSFHKSIQLMLGTTLSFLMILSVTLLSMLMILFSTLSVIRHLICDNNSSWLLDLKGHECRFENLSICLCSYGNDTLKISHSES